MDENIKKRMAELADRSYSSGMYTFTDFLGLAEQSDFWSVEREVSHAGYKVYGGYREADRVMVRFGDPGELGYEVDFPIVCIHITPLMKKFSDDLTHRDFLGALMNLGIERATLGDIKVNEKEAYVFCLESMSDFIKENLTRVKHTSVNVTVIDDTNRLAELFMDEEPGRKNIIVSSLRADAVISKVYNLSRNDSLNLFRAQKIFINGRLTEENAKTVKTGDVINARGFGKFKINSEPAETRKGRISVETLIW